MENSNQSTSQPKQIFINVSNHPVSKWSDDQKLAALAFGEVHDCQHPEVDPEATADQVKLQAFEFCKNQIQPIAAKSEAKIVVLHLMGEYTFVRGLLMALRANTGHVRHVVSTTRRTKVETPLSDGSVRSEFQFRFIQFREVPF